MRYLIKKISSILVEWFQPKHKMEYKEEVPQFLAEKTIYVIGNPSTPWLIAFKCPCGCNNVIHLNLLSDAKPQWRFYITTKKRVSISPSVWRTTGCKSHFFIRKSKVRWI